MYSTILLVSYLVLLVTGIIYMTFLRIRSNRTYFYYALIWYSLALLLLILIRFLEIVSIEHEVVRLYNQVGLILMAVLIPLTINMLYTLAVKRMLPFIIQMTGGAAALSLILFFWPFVSTIGEQFGSDYSNLWFLIYIWLPAILFIFSIPLISLAIKYCLINVSSLSVERILTGSPDLYFYIDSFGRITDHNASEEVWGKCRDRSDLIRVLEKLSTIRVQDGWPILRDALLLPESKVTGEIKVQTNDLEIWFDWMVKPLKNSRDKLLGSFLLLSDRTAVKQYLSKLNQQNEELQQANNELADYEALVDRYTELAARQEVADYIDVSVRYRILQSFDYVKSLKNRGGDSSTCSLAVDHLRAECRRALSDVRSLVKRLAQ